MWNEEAGMKWENNQFQWYYILCFAVAFGAPMSLIFKNVAMGIPLGLMFGLAIALALAQKHWAVIEGDDLVFGVGEKTQTIPLGQIEHLDFDESKGGMAVRTHDGTAHSLDTGWDKKGLREFVSEVKQKYQL